MVRIRRKLHQTHLAHHGHGAAHHDHSPPWRIPYRRDTGHAAGTNSKTQAVAYIRTEKRTPMAFVMGLGSGAGMFPVSAAVLSAVQPQTLIAVANKAGMPCPSHWAVSECPG